MYKTKPPLRLVAFYSDIHTHTHVHCTVWTYVCTITNYEKPQGLINTARLVVHSYEQESLWRHVAHSACVGTARPFSTVCS